MSEDVKRRYHSPTRAAQAEQTRRRILDAALQLFVERGYAGTTVAAVARSAGVVPETVYLVCGAKRGLLEAVIGTAIAGEEASMTPDGAWLDAVDAIPDARGRLAKLVEYSCGVLARTRPVHLVIRGAADKEPFAAALQRRLVHERVVAQSERIRRFLDDDLRPGLSPSEAGERYCVLASPEVYHLLIDEFEWSADRHRAWLTRLLESELLDS